MIREFCDRCNFELDPAKKIRFEFLSPYGIQFNYKGSLCPACANMVRTFIRGSKSRGEEKGSWEQTTTQ